MNYKFLLLISINIFCYFIRAVYEILNYKKIKFVKSKIVFVIVSIAMGGMWISWFNLGSFDPIIIKFPLWLSWSGFGVLILGIIIFLVGLMQIMISGIIDKRKKEQKLITSGIFYFFRHPMYIGFILWVIGHPIYNGAVITLLYGIFCISNIIVWQFLEEKELVEKFPEYLEYKRKTVF